ncbi:formiminoglutamate deiminase [Branchiibius hedensis]|uniref:Formiminoglutamate deiminase n=1 Tax=Branchiibius hedensis TaxID=672460 RepID=A0A2Y8ZWG8_9MICO|nr:formimidoylglutamate deiminase [Branchiibius hedensis]PWJ26807.1 formiminoglutamate deiminase [Branchiibius hedensis]SSA35618.1 formiminoglutamate deiminase [Branchiibius hedensis]
MTSYWASRAWLADGIRERVTFEVSEGVFTAITPESDSGDAYLLPGLVLPGFANDHSHAFHRALRGRTHADGGTFWTWRTAMYSIAAQLDPDSYYQLARATYAEMVLAGYTSVSEFHYLHHGPDGAPYADPNAMGQALIQAAQDAGISITLLDTCYLHGGLGPAGYLELDHVQTRFADANVSAWAERVSQLKSDDGVSIGTAVHSVRAVTPAELAELRQHAPHVQQGTNAHHIHLSEQPAENDATLAHFGRTPTQLLADAGLVDADLTAVHATHLTEEDIALLGGAGTTACFCPTTERDLADGIGPAPELVAAGARLSLGSDQHAVIDPFEEIRGLEMNERLRSLRRGTFTPMQLLDAATTGATFRGWQHCGPLQVGNLANLVAVRTGSPRTAGCSDEQLIFGATAADVDTVVVRGEIKVADGQHVLGDVGQLLADAIGPLWD